MFEIEILRIRNLLLGWKRAQTRSVCAEVVRGLGISRYEFGYIHEFSEGRMRVVLQEKGEDVDVVVWWGGKMVLSPGQMIVDNGTYLLDGKYIPGEWEGFARKFLSRARKAAKESRKGEIIKELTEGRIERI